MLDRLEQLEKAATPGPWNDEFVRLAIRHLWKNVDPDDYTMDEACRLNASGATWRHPEDSAAIAALRNAAPALFAVAKAASRTGLMDYHMDTCMAVLIEGGECTCGADELRKAIAQLKEATNG